MTKKYASERAAALIDKAIGILQRREDERSGAELKEFTFELGHVMEEEGAAAVAQTFDAIYREADADAKLHGARSEAAHRLQLIQTLVTAGSKTASRTRRGKGSTWTDGKRASVNSSAMERLLELTAVKVLHSPPPKERVIPIPAEDSGSGRERLLMQIGRRQSSWVGSFERGNNQASTAQLMPDGHLFVAACGAGYILDRTSHALIEKIGDDVMTVGLDDSGTLFLVTHDAKVIECFAPSGRLWKTPPLGTGGFRGLTITGDELRGEARQEETEWAEFKVKLANGRVIRSPDRR
jgi:hypothetical protein